MRGKQQQRVRKIWRLGLSIVIAAVLGAQPSFSQSKVYDEYAIKAAYLYNLGKFVEWPASDALAEHNSETKSEFEICIYGRDPYGEKIDAVSKRTIKGRPISVTRHGRLAVDSCDVVFIGQSESYKMAEAILFFADSPVLTIGEDSEFVEKGGLVGLVADQKRVTFEINLQAARAAKLEFSSQLLRLATRLVE